MSSTTLQAQNTVLQAAIKARQSTVLWGDPGISKSSTVRAIAEAEGLLFEVLDLTGKEPTDIGGYPHLVGEGDKTELRFAPIALFRRLIAAGEGVLLIDEVGSADPSVQAASMALVNDRMVGDLRLPDGIVIILAGNPPTSATNPFTMAAPLANRLLHIEFEQVGVEDFALGLVNGFESITPTFDTASDASEDEIREAAVKVGAFLIANPTWRHNLPEDRMGQSGAWPSSRSWTGLARVLAYIDPADTAAVLLASAGIVGDAAAREFATFVRFGDLPDPREVLDDPTLLNWSDRQDRVHAVLLSVASAAIENGTTEMWNKAWTVLGGAQGANKVSLAAATARQLTAHTPAGASIPADAAIFGPAMARSGLVVAA